MTRTESGRIVLVRFPFTDFTSSKRRPALVISGDEYFNTHGDVVLLALTSQPQSSSGGQVRQWREAGLRKPTWIKPVIMTVSSHVITEALGTIRRSDKQSVRWILNTIVNESFWED